MRSIRSTDHRARECDLDVEVVGSDIPLITNFGNVCIIVLFWGVGGCEGVPCCSANMACQKSIRAFQQPWYSVFQVHKGLVPPGKDEAIAKGHMPRFTRDINNSCLLFEAGCSLKFPKRIKNSIKAPFSLFRGFLFPFRRRQENTLIVRTQISSRSQSFHPVC